MDLDEIKIVRLSQEQVLDSFDCGHDDLNEFLLYDCTFSINNIWALGLSAIVLTVMDYLIIKFTGLHAMAFGKVFVGFMLSP